MSVLCCAVLCCAVCANSQLRNDSLTPLLAVVAIVHQKSKQPTASESTPSWMCSRSERLFLQWCEGSTRRHTHSLTHSLTVTQACGGELNEAALKALQKQRTVPALRDHLARSYGKCNAWLQQQQALLVLLLAMTQAQPQRRPSARRVYETLRVFASDKENRLGSVVVQQ